MDNRKKHLSEFSEIDLTEKQSVRTTFRLKEKTYENMALLAKSYKITQKDLLDHMVTGVIKWIGETPNKNRAKKFTEILKDEKQKITRKTQVIGRSSLNIVKKLSKELQISRDVLIELAVILLRTKIEVQQEKHEKALELMRNLSSHAEDTHEKLNEFLSKNDPILNRLSTLSLLIDNLFRAIKAEIHRGVPIDPDDISQNS